MKSTNQKINIYMVSLEKNGSTIDSFISSNVEISDCIEEYHKVLSWSINIL